MGNHPSVDLMVNSPNKTTFSIDVKGLYKRNFWVVKPKKPLRNLFYVFAFVPNDAQNKFFVLTQQQVNEEIEAGIMRARERAIKKGRSGDKAGIFPCVSWTHAEKFEDAWKDLPK